jgi:hypothetical protein
LKVAPQRWNEKHEAAGPSRLTCVRIQDILTDDEIISDSYDLKVVDGVVYEVDCSMITLGAVNVGPFPSIPGVLEQC